MNTNHGLGLWRDNWNPVSEFRREFDRLFDDFAPSTRGLKTEASFAPACDVREEDGHYLLSLEMPGVKKEDLKIEVWDSQLHVSGERRLETQGDREGSMYSERRFGKFCRSFALPVGVDTGQVEASYQDGILQILVPKAESAKPRQIQISNGIGASSFLGRFLNKSKGKEDTQSSIAHRSQSVAS